MLSTERVYAGRVALQYYCNIIKSLQYYKK